MTRVRPLFRRRTPTLTGPGVSGPVRVDARTKNLTKRLQPGDIAVIEQSPRKEGRLMHAVLAPNGAAIEGARAEVAALGAEIRVGTVFNGKVVSIKDFCAFIELAPGTDGMCHISELASGYVKQVTDVVGVGDELRVKVISVDDQGRIKLSRKAVLMEEQAQAAGAAS